MSLLTTKLYIPPGRPESVSRPRLIERLDAGLLRKRKLTLVSAPAGFGKTTLLSEWVTGCGRPVAWLSLDEGDNDPTRFWSYLSAALQKAQSGIGETALTMLRSTPPPAIEAILTTLINEITARSLGLVLILDDYQMIKEQSIHETLAFLLDHLPPQMHLGLATRMDPPLNIARLRIRGQMTELRADDLRFTPDEAASFLNQVMDLGLSQKDVAALEARTEGWIAGLQVAAMAMQGQDNLSGFIAAFTGSHRYILSYLVEEVLQQQPEHVWTFLLQTAILDQLSASLCDVVTGISKSAGRGDDDYSRIRRFAGSQVRRFADSSQQILEYLERNNLFVIPLDDEQRWYRYHHLFGDVLRARLEREFEAREIQTLHRRASDWYEQHGFALRGVQHALDTQDHEHAAQLIERHAEEIFQRSELNTLLEWIRALPDELVEERPLLSMIYGWVLLATGHADEAERCMHNIERAVGATADVLAADSAERRSLTPEALGALVEVTVLRISQALGQFDIPFILELTQRMLPYVDDDTRPYLYNHPADLRSVVIFDMALAYEFSGQVNAARQAFADAAELSREQRNQFILLMAMSHLAQLQVLQGQLWEAEKTYRQALQWGTEIAGPSSPIAGFAHIGLGNLSVERNELDAALTRLQEGIALLEPWRNREGLLAGYIGLARVKRAQGDWSSAFEAVDALAELCSTPDAQMVLPVVEAFRALLSIEQGNLDAAQRWAGMSGLSADGALVYLREGETLIFARALVAQGKAQGKLDDAIRLLTRLLAAAQDGERGGRVIEVLVLQAVALKAQVRQAEALAALERALVLAEPEGYARVFIDQGDVMAELLSQVDILPAYVGRLLAALENETKAKELALQSPRPEGVGSLPKGRTAEEPALPLDLDQSSLVEPLSERELELLRLIAAGMTNRTIAESLMVSVNTVKTHARSIYGKLGVRNRTQAAARARELGLI